VVRGSARGGSQPHGIVTSRHVCSATARVLKKAVSDACLGASAGAQVQIAECVARPVFVRWCWSPQETAGDGQAVDVERLCGTLLFDSVNVQIH
jgi:hypothetical protein